jgi:branched-chain amino acid transport system ATP-binding protein
MTGALLRIEHLVKRFGGLTANNDLTLEVMPGELHALIGPNGAGKSTLIAQIMGELRPDHGRILLDGVDLHRSGPAARTRRGLARTFQIVQLLPDATALENVALAVQARQHHSFGMWRDARGDAVRRDTAQHFLAQVDLPSRAQTPAAELAHGEQKQLELAIALATQPKLLLLDEPLAGLGPAESQLMVEILGTLKGRIAMLLVEHDMDAVYALADRISVLVNGGLIATGSADQIQADAAVRTAYLGDDILPELLLPDSPS